jgi:hypothetical protein
MLLELPLLHRSARMRKGWRPKHIVFENECGYRLRFARTHGRQNVMPANSKEYQRSYMKPIRVVNSLQKHAKALHKLVKEYAETLQECVKVPLQKDVKECADSLQECVKTLQESVKGSLQKDVKETCEIGSKTQFSGENSHSRAGGVGGELCFKPNVTRNINSKAFKANLSKSNRENFSKKEKKEYWKNLEERFMPYCAVYPIEGQTEPKSCLERYNVIKASMPSVARFYGVVKWKQENAWNLQKEGYVPKMLKFMNEEEWSDKKLPARAKAWINKNMQALEKAAQIKIANFKGGSNDG